MAPTSNKKHNNDTAMIAMMIGKDKVVAVDEESIIGVELDKTVVALDSAMLAADDDECNDVSEDWSIDVDDDDDRVIVAPTNNDATRELDDVLIVMAGDIGFGVGFGVGLGVGNGVGDGVGDGVGFGVGAGVGH
mmetsp:Transcript_12864/g.21920  ORF Transcript_12864/g.21920 Transcript_12864/m.21920 type:complete len:134 (-) Transcript_12864:41-442(-)